MPGNADFQVGGRVFNVAFSSSGATYCTGEDTCGEGDCGSGPATHWNMYMVPVSGHNGWWQVDADIPAEVCNCGPAVHPSCDPPGCVMLSGCGEQRLSARMFDTDSHILAVYTLGFPQAENLSTTLPLHAIETTYGVCDIGDPCDPGPPTVNVSQGAHIAAYLLVRNYDAVAGVQTAFDWGNWTFLGGIWDCQAGQIWATVPSPPGGPHHGTITTAFNCVTGGSTEVIGRMHMIATGPGCLVQVESDFPFETHVVSCEFLTAPALPENRGSICVDSGGVDACGPGSVAVDAATWGRIKAQYR
jgi:hypothetical protein